MTSVSTGGFLTFSGADFVLLEKKNQSRMLYPFWILPSSWVFAKNILIPKSDQEKHAVIKEAIFQSALWSLRSNCQMHPKVLAICEKTSNKANSADGKSSAAD